MPNYGKIVLLNFRNKKDDNLFNECDFLESDNKTLHKEFKKHIKGTTLRLS